MKIQKHLAVVSTSFLTKLLHVAQNKCLDETSKEEAAAIPLRKQLIQ